MSYEWPPVVHLIGYGGKPVCGIPHDRLALSHLHVVRDDSGWQLTASKNRCLSCTAKAKIAQ